MKTHTNNYKNNIKEFGREIDVKITYSQNDETIELGTDELFSANLHYEGAILKSVMKQLDIDSKADIPLETILNAQFGLKVNGQYEYINLGDFVVYKSEKQEDTGSYKLTCYDKMLYSMKDYETLGITYPITIRNYINALCTKIALSFANASDTFANYDKQIASELFLDSNGKTLGYTYRDVLDQLAEVTASTICINDSGELEIRYITDTHDTINEDYLKNINVKFGKKYGPINSLVLSRAADSDITNPVEDAQSIAQNGLCQIKIKDNQIMNWQDRETYMQDIFDELDGLEYYINDFSSPGITYYDLCDKYTVSVDNINYSCVMLNDEINITQGLEENIYTDMPSEDEPVYKKSDKQENKTNQAYIIADKANAKIEQVVSAVGDNGEVTAGSIILAINDDTSQLSIDADKININGVISANRNFEIDTSGNMTCSNATINGTLEKAVNNVGTIKIGKGTSELMEFSWNSSFSNYLTTFFPNNIRFIKDNNYLANYKDNYINLFDDYGNLNIYMTGSDGNARFYGTVAVNKLTAGNIDSGTCTLNSSTNVSVSFNKTFTSVPRVVLTPNTTTSGVIAPKIREVTTTGFKAIIGGSVSGNITCDWIAIG